MKLIHGALMAAVALAVSTGALAEGAKSKAIQLSDAQMAKVTDAGASVDKYSQTITLVFNSGNTSQVNLSSGRGANTVNSCYFTC